MAHEETTVTRWSSAESFYDQFALGRRTAGSARLFRAMTCSYISPVSIFSSNNEKRLQIVHEIVETEEKYVSCLYILKSVFEDPLQDLGLIPTKDLEIIFPKELDQLRNEHKILLSKLKQLLKCWNLESCVGEIFADLFSKKGDMGCLWEQYSAYLNNFPKAISTTQKATKLNNKFAQVLEDYSSNPFCEGLNLPAFLLTPIQRLPRYVLLLKQLSKNTDCSHPDKVQIDHAVEVMTQVMNELNDSIEMSLQVASDTKWQKRQVTAKRKISRTDKELIQVQIGQRLPELSVKLNDSSTSKRLSSSFGGSLDGTADRSLSPITTPNRPLSLCSRTSNATTSVGNRSSGYFSEEDHPFCLDSLSLKEQSRSSPFLYGEGQRYGSGDIPQSTFDDTEVTKRVRKTSFSKMRRSSMNYVVLQAVVKWKQFTRKKIHLKEESQKENAQHNTVYTRSSISESSDPCQDKTASTCSMSTVLECNAEYKYRQGMTNDQHLVTTANTETVENWSANENFALNLKLQEKKPAPERKKSIRESFQSSDFKQFLPILESENETDVKSCRDSDRTATAEDNPWLLTERETNFRSRSRDRNDPFRKSTRRALTQSPLRPLSLKSKCSSDQDIFVKGDVDILSPRDKQPHHCISTVNSNIMINEPCRHLSSYNDEDLEEVNINNGKPSSSPENKGRKFLRRPYFRILKWLTAIRRRRKRRRSMARKKKTGATDYYFDRGVTKEQTSEDVLEIEHVTSL